MGTSLSRKTKQDWIRNQLVLRLENKELLILDAFLSDFEWVHNSSMTTGRNILKSLEVKQIIEIKGNNIYKGAKWK